MDVDLLFRTFAKENFPAFIDLDKYPDLKEELDRDGAI